MLRLVTALVSLIVAGQSDFDALPGKLTAAIGSGAQTVEVTILPGQYFYREGHLAIRNVHRADLAVSFQAEGAVFIGDSSASDGYLDAFISLPSLSSADVLPECRQVRKRPEIVDRQNGLCRVRTREKSLSAQEADGTYLVLTQWYTSRIFPVRRIESGYVYFTADPLESNGNPAYDPDSDYKYGRVLPRYMVVNAKKAPRRLHRTSVSRFLTVSGSELGSFSWRGGRFLGNGGKDCLVQFYGVKADSLVLRQCLFEHIHGNVVQVQYSSGFHFLENQVSHIWKSGIIIDYFSPEAVVSGNTFEDVGLLMMQDFAVIARGSDFDIRNNLFRDFTYGAVGVGTYYRETIPPSSSGFVRDNEMYCTDGFSRYLMDSGAIYTWTINKDVTLSGNYIHDIGGYGDNRGIFCDDGTVNVTIVNNKVVRIRNSWCIDLRRVAKVEKDPRSAIRRSNVGNRMENNVVDGKVRFINLDD